MKWSPEVRLILSKNTFYPQVTHCAHFQLINSELRTLYDLGTYLLQVLTSEIKATNCLLQHSEKQNQKKKKHLDSQLFVLRSNMLFP